MRIVRFMEMVSEVSDIWLPAHWGILVDSLVYPLAQAPYLDLLDDGTFAPEVNGPPIPVREGRLLAPVMPSKILCVGRNYAEHAAELGNEVPTEPMIFYKPPTSIIGPDQAVVYPAISERVDHEGELAVIIGRRCRNVREEDAMSVIFGYSVANDVTARD